jgi:2-polyprenyl-3-methyl-5-hydroxy-6-metoxy-1,4-benzoquinol methylase
MDNRYLSGEYLEKNPSYHVEDSAWKAKQVLTILGRNNLPKINTVCEVGCGAGEILYQLQKQMDQSIRFSGYEISPQGYELCKPKANPKLQFINKDILTEPKAHFDLMLFMDVVEHIPDYLGFLVAIKKNADTFIFHLPLDLSAQTVLRGTPLLRSWEKTGHLHFFTKDLALAALKETGFEVLDWFYTPAGVERGKKLSAKLASLPRRMLFGVNKNYAVRLLGGYSLLVLAK